MLNKPGPVLALLVLVSLSIWGGLIACTHEVFERPPEQYTGKPVMVALQVDDQATIRAQCEGVGLPPGTIACASPYLMKLPDPCDWQDPYAQLMCHELGHVNGWPPHHPRS